GFPCPLLRTTPDSVLPTDFPAAIRARAARVKLAVFDVDGVLTDGRLLYPAEGHEIKAFHVRDGLGLKRLLANGIEVAIITARFSNAVTERMAELGVVHVYQDQQDKLACLVRLRNALGIAAEDVCYTGDDLPDLAPMRSAGLAVAPADAHDAAQAQAHWRTRNAGGHGAVREVADLILDAKGLLAADLQRFLG